MRMQGLPKSIGLAAAVLATTLVLPAGAEAAGDSAWRSGDEVYAKVCGRCHESGVGPVIRGRKLEQDYITAVVRNGLLAMPAFPASAIDDAALAKVAALIAKSPNK